MFGSVMFFSPDGKFLVSLGSGGPGRVWDLTSSTVVASLPKENVSNYFVVLIFSCNILRLFSILLKLLQELDLVNFLIKFDIFLVSLFI